MKKLIVSDIDGTLLRSDKTYNLELLGLIEKLAKKDIYFSLASGRPSNNLKNLLRDKKALCYYVADNGATVDSFANSIYADFIESHYVKRIVEIGLKHPETVMVVCTSNKAYIYHAESSDSLKEVFTYYPVTVKASKLEEIKEEVVKISFWNEESSSKNIYPFYQEFSDELNVVLASTNWLDIMNKGINKQVGVSKLAEYLGVLEDDIYIFGDYLNDLDLFTYFKNTYAPSNAHVDIKKLAKEVILSNDEDGVYLKIKELFGE